MTKILKFYRDFKAVILILLVFFALAYIAIRFDQAMGWEKARTEKNLRENRATA